VAVLGTAASARPARAANCQILRYTFQPDCYRSNGSATCDKPTLDRLDFGPQIAVWIESADGTQFIDTLMVTSLVATRGIGNRPGIWNFRSSPKFPYGKRRMALPIWAYARGQLYPTVVMQDGNESAMGFHECCSSPEHYFCRPLMPTDINLNSEVDAITCPTTFNSSKGRIDNTVPKQYYPPRNDLGSDRSTFISRDCAAPGDSFDTCMLDELSYPTLNDLDAVSAATPGHDQPYSGIWYIPANLAPGDYAVMVEVNKEFDNPASAALPVHPSYTDPQLQDYGLPNNFGQPSVLYKVPIHIDAAGTLATGSTMTIEGYSDWMGATGTIYPKDGTISTDTPGSGEARLLAIPGPTGVMGRVHVALDQCSSMGGPDGGTTNTCDADALPPAPPPVVISPLSAGDLEASQATIHFLNSGVNGNPVVRYDIRYAATAATSMSETDFLEAAPAGQVIPSTPGSAAQLTITALKPNMHYLVGIRSEGPCMVKSAITFVDFTTPAVKFVQLSGCFVATAAYGSAMDHEVAALREARDRLRPRSGLFAAATELYYREGPAAADVVRRSDTARAVARRLIGPIAGLAEIAARVTGN
jgi:hypothetical protein